MKYIRYAVYYAPRAGQLADLAAAWLGWDNVVGCICAQPSLGGLEQNAADLTQDALRYGFHGTLKAPFRLAETKTQADLSRATQDLATRLPALEFDGLILQNLHGFLALCPKGSLAALSDLAGQVVSALDPWRAPLTQAEVARRCPDALSDYGRMMLVRWGYPFVMDDFKFHLTLTNTQATPQTAAVLAAYFAPELERAFLIEDLCLFGQTPDGYFHLIARHPLTAVKQL
ncbi:MAG: DUF1045 domain-containing protein [Paracoccaceae bacterium]|jgi:hypothetical protein|nr:DUF1045 domain-containing protein [Paracoccaceae bacterium]MDO7660270.1 DUF1045 domain-containing protein [Paracoccaceae bacterium]NQV67447.1 DUF1045 domain-containing protein [Paracoccaceae bacterium]